MSNNRAVENCKLCNSAYCMECSDHEGWEEFCSDSCAKEYEEDNKEVE